jgi:hypothetical protein
LHDPPIGIDRGCDLADAADDGLLSEALFQNVDVTHPVQHRDDCRLRTNSGREIGDRRIKRIGFHGQQHGIVGRIDVVSGDKVRPHRHVAVRADDLQTGFPELGGTPRPHQER